MQARTPRDAARRGGGGLGGRGQRVWVLVLLTTTLLLARCGSFGAGVKLVLLATRALAAAHLLWTLIVAAQPLRLRGSLGGGEEG